MCAMKAIRWICTGYPNRGNRRQLPCVGESLRLEPDCYKKSFDLKAEKQSGDSRTWE